MASRHAEVNRLNSDLVNVQTSAQLAIVLLGRDLTIRRFSVQAEKQLNLLASDVGRPLGHVRHNLELPDLEPFIVEVINGTGAREREVQDKDGRWFSLRVRPYLTSDNKVDGAVLVLVDINDLKRHELATTSAREYAENIIGTMREPLVVLDPDLRVESVNRAFYRTFRVTPADTLARFIYELGNRQWDIPELRALLGAVIPQSHTIEDFLVEGDFEHLGRRSMLVNARRMHSHHGVHGRIVVAIEDITERRQTEVELRDSEDRYRTLFDLGPVGVYSCDATGVIQEFNRRAAELWGRKPVPGDTVHRFCGSVRMFRPDGSFLPHARCPMAEVVSGRISEVRDSEVHIERPDGTRITVVVNIRPLKNLRGDITGAINCFYDITERKRAEEALRDSDRRKNEFLAMLAHELRNPLAPILASIEVLRRVRLANAELESAEGAAGSEELIGRGDHALNVLQRQVGQMVRLVDDLLDAGRISRGKIDLRRERVELSSAIYHAVDAARPIAERRGQELTVALPGVPLYLDADATRLGQIVGNLLNNACKFTERGGHIWLTVEREEEAGATLGEGLSISFPQVAIRVRDTGVGIAPDQLERVFEMFTQVDRSLERSLSGLGIGLTLVRALTEMHGGTVEVHSDGIGQGSEFIVRLPVAEQSGAAPSPGFILPEAVPTPPLRVLIVDDNHDSAGMLAALLEFSGHETFEAYDGLAAVEAASTLDPDVILLDIGLPGLNGYEAARRIRDQQGTRRRPLLVALTGWGQEEDRRRSEESGFDAHLVKPVDHDVLTRLLAELSADRQAVRE
jgi:signal transduction histidine kinase/CheY-like chemotaxis protein